MNIELLEKILHDNNVNPNCYSIGERMKYDGMLSMKIEDGKWTVFVEERGNPIFNQIFFREDEACEFFLNKIRGLPDVKIYDQL